jgi:hypothetical protein
VVTEVGKSNFYRHCIKSKSRLWTKLTLKKAANGSLLPISQQRVNQGETIHWHARDGMIANQLLPAWKVYNVFTHTPRSIWFL